MMTLHNGQCGMCTHFGESHPTDSKLVQMRTKHQAPETALDECGHPKHSGLHLMVTPISGCDGFQAATEKMHA